MKIGVMFNPGAGGSSSFSGIGKDIENLFEDHEMLTGNTVFGEDYISGAERADGELENDFETDLGNILLFFHKRKVEMIIAVGGDGFLTHIAAFLIRRNIKIPLLGLAGGTANIGPLIKFNKKTLNSFNAGVLILEKVGCIEVRTADKILGYAFCDVILGDTFLGTIENGMCNLSTRAFLETGDKVEIEPGEHITGKKFTLLINNKKKKIKSVKIAQIIISPLYFRDFYRGKAITGALCFSIDEDNGAAIGISDSIVVSKDFPDVGSITMEHFLFGKKDSVQIDGIREGISVIIDGNVYEINNQSVKLRFIEDGAQSVTPEVYNGLPVKS